MAGELLLACNRRSQPPAFPLTIGFSRVLTSPCTQFSYTSTTAGWILMPYSLPSTPPSPMVVWRLRPTSSMLQDPLIHPDTLSSPPLFFHGWTVRSKVGIPGKTEGIIFTPVPCETVCFEPERVGVTQLIKYKSPDGKVPVLARFGQIERSGYTYAGAQAFKQGH